MCGDKNGKDIKLFNQNITQKTSEFVFVVINFNGKLYYTESPQEYLMEQNSVVLGALKTQRNLAFSIL